MVPMLALSTAVVKGLGGGNQLQEVVYHYIDSLEQSAPVIVTSPVEDGEQEKSDSGTPPAAGLTEHLRSAANKIFDYVNRTNFATLGTFGMLGVFLSVILVLNQIETAMNAIWHVEAGRSILRKISDYLTLMILMPLSLNVALAAGTILESQALTQHLNHFIPGAWIRFLLLDGIPVFFLTLTLYILYIFFPNTKPKFIPTMIGALLAGLLWFVIQNLYISLQIGVAKYNAIYGSFATFPLFLAWIYLGWLFVLLGAQLAYAIQNCRQYQLVEKSAVPTVRLSAALDMCSLVCRRFLEEKGTTLDDVLIAYPFYNTRLLEQVQSSLIEENILHHSRETKELMPSRPPELITHQQIVEASLGTESPDSEGGKQSAAALQAASGAVSETDVRRDEDGSESLSEIKDSPSSPA
jgi:membrane protein